MAFTGKEKSRHRRESGGRNCRQRGNALVCRGFVGKGLWGGKRCGGKKNFAFETREGERARRDDAAAGQLRRGATKIQRPKPRQKPTVGGMTGTAKGPEEETQGLNAKREAEKEAASFFRKDVVLGGTKRLKREPFGEKAQDHRSRDGGDGILSLTRGETTSGNSQGRGGNLGKGKKKKPTKSAPGKGKNTQPDRGNLREVRAQIGPPERDDKRQTAGPPITFAKRKWRKLFSGHQKRLLKTKRDASR